MAQRIDTYLAGNGYASSREKAKALIKAGAVFADGKRVDKPSQEVAEGAEIQVRGNVLPYVSRGGLKLEKALREWQLVLTGKVCMDVGASTGGFTDCMLQNGAKKVFAVDVGTGQLHSSLLADERVVNLEQTNFRGLTAEDLGEQPGFASVDVSFISLVLIFPGLFRILTPGGEAVCLVKPQFEAGKGAVGKNGVVKDAKTHERVLRQTVNAAEVQGFRVLGLTFSPIRGPEGNIEYLICLKKTETAEELPDPFDQTGITALVASSHRKELA